MIEEDSCHPAIDRPGATDIVAPGRFRIPLGDRLPFVVRVGIVGTAQTQRCPLRRT